MTVRPPHVKYRPCNKRCVQKVERWARFFSVVFTFFFLGAILTIIAMMVWRDITR